MPNPRLFANECAGIERQALPHQHQTTEQVAAIRNGGYVAIAQVYRIAY